MHELIQRYFDTLYQPLQHKITPTMLAYSNQIYGELYYYSIVKLLKYVEVNANDSFLDLGSGLGRAALQIFLTTKASTVRGVEINHERYAISHSVQQQIQQQLPQLFINRNFAFVHGDFLKSAFIDVSIIYVCSTVFSYDLLCNIGSKINAMPNVKTVISLRKLPNLHKFSLAKKIFLQCSWDIAPCYIYYRDF